MDLDRIKEILRSDEGLRLKKYRCSAGVPSIAYGHTRGHIPDECTLDQAEVWLQEDIEQAIYDAMLLVCNLYSLSEARQQVVVCMSFQLGYRRLSGFRRFLGALQNGFYDEAAEEMKDSKWYRQCPARVGRLAEMMRAG